MRRSRRIFLTMIGGAILIVLVIAVIIPKFMEISSTVSATATAEYVQNNITQIRVVYDTDKEVWLKDAIARFTAANPDIWVDAVGQDSMDTYATLSELTDGDKTLPGSQPIPVVWSPASTLEVNLLNAASKTALNRDLAVDCKPLVTSPLVIVAWSDRAQAFANAYKDKGGISFDNLYDALHSSTTNGQWSAVGGSANWGLIKLGEADPLTSDSGVMDLLALASNYYKRTTPLSVSDLSNQDFINWLSTLQTAATTPLAPTSSALISSVIDKGPAAYDFALTYEALAIQNLKNAQSKQGQAWQVIYPAYNVESDNPLCIIDHPTVTTKQRDAATKLQAFLLSSDMQQLALSDGYRPTDATIQTTNAFNAADLKAAGISANAGQIAQAPDSNTILQLLAVWNRAAVR